MRTFQHLFFGYPFVALGAFIALSAHEPTSAIAGAAFMLCGTIALITTPKTPPS